MNPFWYYPCVKVCSLFSPSQIFTFSERERQKKKMRTEAAAGERTLAEIRNRLFCTWERESRREKATESGYPAHAASSDYITGIFGIFQSFSLSLCARSPESVMRFKDILFILCRLALLEKMKFKWNVLLWESITRQITWLIDSVVKGNDAKRGPSQTTTKSSGSLTMHRHSATACLPPMMNQQVYLTLKKKRGRIQSELYVSRV